MHTRSMPLGEDVDLAPIARQTSGLTGADLANLCNEAAIYAGRKERDRLRTEDFEHALMSHLVGVRQPVQKVTIISRGRALGYTLNTPQEDRYLQTKEELSDR